MSEIRAYLPENDRWYWLSIDMDDTGAKGEIRSVTVANGADPFHRRRAGDIAQAIFLGARGAVFEDGQPVPPEPRPGGAPGSGGGSGDDGIEMTHRTDDPKLQGEFGQGSHER
jgi:hypothetical protein